MKNICVVHLVRAQNGIEPFVRFLESYCQHDGGVDHDLLIVFKGFDSSHLKEAYLKHLERINFRTFDVPDIGFDITAYFACAKRFNNEYRYFCFLNSYSLIQANGWLNKLYVQISRPKVGVVGATGSWQSHKAKRFIGISLAAKVVEHYRQNSGVAIWKRCILGIEAAYQFSRLLRESKHFPNYHLRTNAFMISSETMVKVECRELVTKFDAYRFESGNDGLTQQILNMGKEVLVVGKDGIGYVMTQWNKSNTFWQAAQENLLVADNQTRLYLHADAEMQSRLSNLAWGKETW